MCKTEDSRFYWKLKYYQSWSVKFESNWMKFLPQSFQMAPKQCIHSHAWSFLQNACQSWRRKTLESEQYIQTITQPVSVFTSSPDTVKHRKNVHTSEQYKFHAYVLQQVNDTRGHQELCNLHLHTFLRIFAK